MKSFKKDKKISLIIFYIFNYFFKYVKKYFINKKINNYCKYIKKNYNVK